MPPARFGGGGGDDVLASRFPACRLVHVGTEDMLETLQDERKAVWEELCRTRDEIAAQPELDTEPNQWERPLMPAPWDPESGWTLDKVRPPMREQIVWSVAEVQRRDGE
ncbi:hypothetical protein MN608_03129 [Microdochium nivale]|nr:hypothetical protein MN608_03129 [Microdochium nivale]